MLERNFIQLMSRKNLNQWDSIRWLMLRTIRSFSKKDGINGKQAILDAWWVFEQACCQGSDWKGHRKHRFNQEWVDEWMQGWDPDRAPLYHQKLMIAFDFVRGSTWKEAEAAHQTWLNEGNRSYGNYYFTSCNIVVNMGQAAEA